MKRQNKLLILVGALIVCIAATFAVLKIEEKKELIKTTDEVIMEVKPETVTSLAFSHDEISLAFHKEDEHWVYDDDSAFPVDDEKLEALLTGFEKMGATFIIEEVEDFSQYGLDVPTGTIELGTEDKDYEITLGAFSTMDAQRYVSLGDGNVYLLKEDPMDTFSIDLGALLKYDELPSFDEVSEIRFSGEQNYRIVCDEDNANTYCVSDKYFAEIDGKQLPLDTDLVKSYLNTVSSLGFTTFKTYNMNEEEKVAFGHDNPQLVIEVDYADLDEEGNPGEKQTFTLYLGRDLDEKTRRDEAAANDEPLANLIVTAYVRVNDSGVVYTISDAKCTKLLNCGYTNLRHTMAMTADWQETIESFDVTLDGETYTYTTEISEEGVRDYYYGDKLVEDTIVRIRTQNIAATDIDSFTADQPTGREEISMVFHLNDTDYPEVRMACYRVDGAKCLVTVNGKPFCYTARENVVDLREAVFADVLGGVYAEEEEE